MLEVLCDDPQRNLVSKGRVLLLQAFELLGQLVAHKVWTLR